MKYNFLEQRKDDLLHIAISYRNCHISYANLYRKIVAAASKLMQLGVKENDRVLLFLPNSINYVVYFFAIEILNATAVLCDIKFEDEVKTVVNDCNVHTIITDSMSIKKLLEKDLNVQCIVNVDIESTDVVYDNISFVNIDDMDRVAMILFTSGTTGKVKGVCNTYATILAAVEHYTNTLSITDNDIMIGVIPFYHSYGFGSCLMAGLSQGAHIILHDKFNPNIILRDIYSYQATIFHGIPYMYDLMSKQIKSGENQLSSLKYCISAGAPLTRGIAETFYELTGYVIHQEYGSTETGTISLNLSEDLEKNIVSVGKPLVGVQLQIQDDAILVSSGSIAKGYIGDIKTPFLSENYNTYDMGYLDDQGYIHISGRQKRMMNIDGLKVNADQVEKIIKQHPEIIDAHVTYNKDDTDKEYIVAYVIKSNKELTEKGLVTYCQNHMAAYKIPKVIHWVDHLNKSSLGKVREEQ